MWLDWAWAHANNMLTVNFVCGGCIVLKMLVILHTCINGLHLLLQGSKSVDCKVQSKLKADRVHMKELTPATHSSNMLQKQSSLVCTNDFMWKKLHNKFFPPGFCSTESNWLINNIIEHASGAYMLGECTVVLLGASSLICCDWSKFWHLIWNYGMCHCTI